MNREILFKAKRLDNGNWVEGALLPTDKGSQKIVTSCLEDLEQRLPLVVCAHDVNSTTVCQYTGLMDKNGKKIWENDIVKLPDGNLNKIDWDIDSAKFVLTDFVGLRVDFDYYYGNELEVIGDIFDNPELMEV